MDKEIKNLMERWESDDILIKKYSEILRSFKSGSVLGISKDAKYYDLRGIKLNPLTNKEREVERVVFIKPNKFSDIDFSYADLSNSEWRNCEFINCKFENTTFFNVKLENCQFKEIDFVNCKFKNSNLGINSLKNSGKYYKVNFIKNTFKYVDFRFPIFDECNFIENNITQVDFDGSRFFNTKFSGIIDSADFRGYSLFASTKILGLFKVFDPLKFKNEMINVDFSNCELKYVGFYNDIDLSKCNFPKGDNYLYIKNPSKCYTQAKMTIQNTWKNDKERKEAINIIDEFWFPKSKHNMKTDFLTKTKIGGFPMQFTEKLFSLIKETYEAM